MEGGLTPCAVRDKRRFPCCTVMTGLNLVSIEKAGASTTHKSHGCGIEAPLITDDHRPLQLIFILWWFPDWSCGEVWCVYSQFLGICCCGNMVYRRPFGSAPVILCFCPCNKSIKWHSEAVIAGWRMGINWDLAVWIAKLQKNDCQTRHFLCKKKTNGLQVVWYGVLY